MNRRNPRGGQPFKPFRKIALPALGGLALLVLAYEFRGFASVHSLLGDFQAFRCAGVAILHGTNPYLSSSLSACEHARAPGGLYAAPKDVVMPAPLPPYALLLFAPFALLPYPVAAAVWLGISAAALAASIVLLVRVLNLSAFSIGCILLLPATVLWLPFGETAPLALLGAATASYALQTRRRVLAAAAFSLIAIEPHVALGAWICTLVAVPRMRLPLAAAGAALVAASFGINSGLVEYLAGVLPLHALAEVPRPVQYSATWLLYSLGATPAAALRAGMLSYVVLLAAGIAAALRLARRWNDVSVCVFAPIAAAVVGGTFVHASHIALALPFAAAVASRESRSWGAAAALACAVLAVPWSDGRQTIVFAGTALMAAIVLALKKDRTLALGGFVASLLFAVMLVAVHRLPSRPHPAPAFPVAERGEAYASASWGRYVWKRQSSATDADWLGKAPTWLALLVLMSAAGAAAAHKEAVVSVLVDEVPAAP